MRRSLMLSATVLGGLVTMSAPALAATAPCSVASSGSVAAYSGNGVEVACTAPASLPDLPFTDSGAAPAVPAVPAAGAPRPGRTLPVTGGEFVLITIVGVGAIAGGGSLLLAGRKRGQAGHVA